MKSKCILIFFLFLCGMLYADLTDVYKKGVIKFIPDPDFGSKITWDDPFFYKPNSLFVLDDGRFFLTIGQQHKVVRFSKDCKVLGNFGRKGLGPADLYQPGSISLLDGKYLVVEEYATLRRFSLFKPDGGYVKVVKADYTVSSCIALRDNKVAIKTTIFAPPDIKILVDIKDIATGKVKPVASGMDKVRMINFKGAPMMAQELANECFVRRTPKGDLLVAFAYDAIIQIYSPEGELVKSFKLKKKPVMVDGDTLDQYRKDLITEVKKRFPGEKHMIAAINAYDLKKLFSRHLPLFKNILVDNEGNILFFDYQLSNKRINLTFDVYSSEGEFVCKSGFDYCNFKKPNPVYIYKLIQFQSGFLYALLDLDDGDDIQTKVIRIKILN